MSEILDRAAIEKLLPHRAPMLLLDTATTEGDTAVCTYAIPPDAYFTRGHFPDNPVVPGVMLCEMMGQSACVLIGDASGKTPYFTGMDGVRFKRVVRPGETITLRSRITRQKGAFYFIEATAHVDGALAAKAELSFALLNNESVN
ncbi:MAG: beta-hydroxyacyl-ACP dehydratase [Oscillospiraceae bacterium]|jgi:3-hydroxyacyl-[acyl-carrier-protein] dehydratase|nr:beta-hydroxyacyl-ACP dehydratase [Oscillospiraceae bacterium]